MEKLVPKVSDNKATQKLEKVYCDVIGPVSPSIIEGNRYAFSFIDEFSAYAVVKFMKYQTQALQTVTSMLYNMAVQKFCELILGHNTKTKALKSFA